MTIRVALHHRTTYRYDRRVALGPQIVRLRPAPHTRTPILAYAMSVKPEDHFVNWQQDPFGNFQSRLVFPDSTDHLEVEVDLIADMTAINPFDFFVASEAESFPFAYEPDLKRELEPYLDAAPLTPKLKALLAELPRAAERTIDYLVAINQLLSTRIGYLIRMEPGVQDPEQTLELGTGSCRDSSWLLVNLLRHLGLAARFVSGYLIQLKLDVEALDGPRGTTKDFTDLHAWAEVFLPGAGWVGMDPTSGLLTSEGHIPLAATPSPAGAAPISGGATAAKEFDFDMTITRIHEDPRVTKPYTESQWKKIHALGTAVDKRLDTDDVRLTMGGEPTFVSIDDMDSPEWTIAAVGLDKRDKSDQLVRRLRDRFAPGALLHFGQGKWYPGESLPRWAFGCYWRKDGQPIWHDHALIAKAGKDYGHGVEEAQRFIQFLASALGVEDQYLIPAYEDALYFQWQQSCLPENLTPEEFLTSDHEERRRLARVRAEGFGAPRGFVMPLQVPWWSADGARWATSHWPLRTDRMPLIPGDSPLGLRLPLAALPHAPANQMPVPIPIDPTLSRDALDTPLLERLDKYEPMPAAAASAAKDPETDAETEVEAEFEAQASTQTHAKAQTQSTEAGEPDLRTLPRPKRTTSFHHGRSKPLFEPPVAIAEAPDVVRTALCVEAREGRLHVFLPPIDRLEDFLELIAAIEWTAASLDMPVQIEGYVPPIDSRLEVLKVTPDPGVIEVNIHPTGQWDELVEVTTTLYDEARLTRLGTEKFDLDGKHTGTGGGNHIVMGGATPLDSPFLRRPDLLASLLTYWQQHPSLSYLFSGRFMGPTSQAPRVDEGRADALYELGIALDTIHAQDGPAPPWLVDRAFRHLLTDLTGNTHRAEVCIDKLYSPDSSTGRLGLVELRGFEMPPHARMSLTQQLLIRSLITWFWRHPLKRRPKPWGTALHDRFLLPHFLQEDLRDVLDDLRNDGIDMDANWFTPHLEFRCPKVGDFTQRSLQVEIRQAIEPWYVLGEEPAGGGMSRGVDSSLERLQVKVSGMTDERHTVACNGRRVPLHPTGIPGEFVAGIRYRAWQPPSCLHPTIPIHTPLAFDLVDTWQQRSIGGATYHVTSPAGNASDRFPVNAAEAEARRAARFLTSGHTAGELTCPEEAPNPMFPMTLDLRR